MLEGAATPGGTPRVRTPPQMDGHPTPSNNVQTSSSSAISCHLMILEIFCHATSSLKGVKLGVHLLATPEISFAFVISFLRH